MTDRDIAEAGYPVGNPEATPECDARLDWYCITDDIWFAGRLLWQPKDGYWFERRIETQP